MIKHIVMWRIKDLHEGMSKDELIAKIKRELEGLKSVIPQIQTMEIGRNFNELPTSFDVALYSEFESNEALGIYQKHPEHVRVAQFIREIRTDAVVVDYET
ncbi:MAG: Dabb family protein [Candidatus Dadabacteria bacterium]|nr:Dabb family protein [Candidatus Dadabacteria bacterium]